MLTHQQQYLMLKRTPLGEVVTNDLKKYYQETADKFMKAYSYGNEVTEVVSSNVNPILTLTLAQDHGYLVLHHSLH